MIFEVLSFLINLELRHLMFVDHCHDVCITFTTSLGRILFSRGLPIGCWCAICIYTVFFFIVIYLWCVQTLQSLHFFPKSNIILISFLWWSLYQLEYVCFSPLIHRTLAKYWGAYGYNSKENWIKNCQKLRQLNSIRN